MNEKESKNMNLRTITFVKAFMGKIISALMEQGSYSNSVHQIQRSDVLSF